jgi:hypothetical protein
MLRRHDAPAPRPASVVAAEHPGIGRESARHWVVQTEVDGGQTLREHEPGVAANGQGWRVRRHSRGRLTDRMRFLHKNKMQPAAEP